MRSATRPALLLVLILMLGPACGPAAAPPPADQSAAAAQPSDDPAKVQPAGVGAAGAAATPGPPVDVVVASPGRSLTQLPFYLGLKEGIYADEGLNVSLVTMASPVAIAAIIDGQVGYSTSGGTTIRAAASGRPVRLIAGGKSRPDWDLMVQPGIDTVEALRGKRIGVQAPTGATTLLTYTLLAKYGIGQSDVEAINLQSTDGILQGLVARQVDAGPLGPPQNIIARREGLRPLLHTGDEVVLLQGGVGTSVQRLQERPAEVEAVLRGLLRSTRLMQSDQAKTVDVLVDEYGMDRDVAEIVYAENVSDFVPDASASDTEIQQEIAAEEQAIGEKLNVTVAQVADFGPLHRAQAAVGMTPSAQLVP